MIDLIRDIRDCFSNHPGLAETNSFCVANFTRNCYIPSWSSPCGPVSGRFCRVHQNGKFIGYVRYNDFHLSFRPTQSNNY